VTAGSTFRRGEHETAWTLTERWRAARLRLALDDMSPPVPGASPEEAEWLRAARRLRSEVRRQQERRRAASFTANLSANSAAEASAESELRAHLEAGRAAEHPVALLLDPRASAFEEAAVVLDGGLAIPDGTALVLNRPEGRMAWTAEGPRPIDDSGAMAELAQACPVWFVQEAPLAEEMVTEAETARFVTFELSIGALFEPRLLAGLDPTLWGAGGEAPVEESFPAATAGSERVEVTTPLERLGSDPFAWRFGPSGSLGDLLGTEPTLASLAVSLAPEPHSDALEVEARREALAAVLTLSRATEVIADGERWTGIAFPARMLPEFAGTELLDSRARMIDGLERGDLVRGLAAATKTLALQREVGADNSEIEETGLLLAQAAGDLKRAELAAAASLDVVESRRAGAEPAALAQALRLHASYALDAKQHEKAVAAYREAAAIEGDLGNPAEQAEMIARAGIALENGGLLEEALATFDEARELGGGLGDQAFVARQWSRRARIELVRLTDYAAAQASFERALVAASESGDTELMLTTRLGLARVAERLALYEEAVATARTVAGEASDAGLPRVAADALLVQAFVEWARADYLTAFQIQREALVLIDGAGAPELEIIAANTAGLVSWGLNDFDRALASFDRAGELALESLAAVERASSLNNRGLVLRSLGRYAEARADFEAALAIDRAERNRWGAAYALRNLAMTSLLEGFPRRALAPLAEAIELSGEIGDRTNLAKALVALGDAHRGLGEPEPARASYERGLELARVIPLPEMQWRAHHGLALLDLAAGDRTGARENLALGIEVVEGLRARIKIEELQDGFLFDKQELYDTMVGLLVDDGDPTAAFEFSERSRGRAFIDLLGNKRLALAEPESEADLSREAAMRAAVEQAERALGAVREGRTERLERQLEEARRAYADFRLELRARDPQLAAFVEVPATRLAEVQALLEPGTRLLVYHLLPDRVIAWVIGPQSIQVASTPADRGELTARLDAFRGRLQDFAPVEEEVAVLSATLIEPVSAALGGATRVGVVPHRDLHRMPFAALTRDGVPMIQRTALFYLPSTTLLRYTVERRARRTGDQRVIAFGNPDLGDASLSLPLAQKEAERLPWSFPQADVFLGEGATESRLVDMVAEYGIVHLASHGEFDPDNPLESGLLLAADDQRDGRLTAADVFGLSLRADLVALSACQTGLGRPGNGDDVVGLNRAFLFAGARQLLASLWRVDDVSTAILVKQFYRRLDGVDRAEALRQAQLEVRRRYPHPAHWSGMFLSGDWQ
jgi:CHAT domain-containing protein